MSFVRRSVAAKMIVVTVPLVAVALAAVAYFAIANATRTAKDGAFLDARTSAAGAAAGLDTKLAEYRADSRLLSSVLAGYTGSDRRALNEMLHRVAIDNPSLLGVYWQGEKGLGPGPDSAFLGDTAAGSGKSGQFEPYWERLKGPLHSYVVDPEADADWYKLPKRTHRFQVIEPYVYGGVLLTSYVSPVLRDGKFVGASGLDTSLAQLDAMVSRVHVLRTGYAFLVSRTGIFISAPDKKLRGKATLQALGRKHDLPQLASLVAATSQGETATLTTTDPFTGKRATMFAQPTSIGNWGLVVVAPTAEIMAGAHRLRFELLLVAAITLLLVGGALFFLMRRLLRPLRAVSEVAEKLAVGETDVTLPRAGEDEFGRMAASFGRTVTYVAEIARSAERVADGDLTATVEPRSERDALGGSLARMIASLREVVGRVSGAASQVATASNHVATTSEDAGRAVGEIANAVGDVAAGAERQVRMVEAARASTQQTSDAAQRAQEVADQGAAAVAEATAAMEVVQSTSTEVSTAIRALAAKSDQIGGIVETITGISGQTNLLALNAAIEAARAGEQGRGFAVVADEVRKLAEESQQAASSIADLIAEIQHDTGNVVEVVEAGAAQTEQGARVVEHAREAFDSIGTAVVEMAAQAGEIATAMSEVVSVAEQSSASTEQVSSSTQETSASTQEIASSAQELARTAANLQELVGRFRLEDASQTRLGGQGSEAIL